MPNTKSTKTVSSLDADTEIEVTTISKGQKAAHKPKVTVLVSTEAGLDAVQDQVGGFVNFLREHAIVGLAVGFVIATQVQSVVKQLIASFLDPLIGLLLNGNKLSALTVTLHWHGRAQQFGWGIFVYVLIDFLFVVITLYTIIKLLSLDKLDKKKT